MNDPEKRFVDTNKTRKEVPNQGDGVLQTRHDGSQELVESALKRIGGRSTADLTANANTTLANVTGLKAALEANGVYLFTVFGTVDAATAADMKIGATVPAGATVKFLSGNNFSADTAVIDGAGAGTPQRGKVVGMVEMGATAGDLQIQAAQNSSDASDATLETGAVLLVERVSR